MPEVTDESTYTFVATVCCPNCESVFITTATGVRPEKIQEGKWAQILERSARFEDVKQKFTALQGTLQVALDRARFTPNGYLFTPLAFADLKRLLGRKK